MADYTVLPLACNTRHLPHTLPDHHNNGNLPYDRIGNYNSCSGVLFHIAHMSSRGTCNTSSPKPNPNQTLLSRFQKYNLHENRVDLNTGGCMTGEMS